MDRYAYALKNDGMPTYRLLDRYRDATDQLKRWELRYKHDPAFLHRLVEDSVIESAGLMEKHKAYTLWLYTHCSQCCSAENVGIQKRRGGDVVVCESCAESEGE